MELLKIFVLAQYINIMVIKESQKTTPQYEIEEDDIPFEEEILRHSYNVPSWTRYVDHKLSKNSPFFSIFVIYERALKILPGSYKLWNAYLKLRRHHVREKNITDPGYELTNEAHKRALIFMNKMPRIWIEFCKFMTFQRLVTRTRRVFDDALRALPVTQHSRIWPLYIEFLHLHDIPETGVLVFRRYLKLAPENVEEYVEYLVRHGRVDEAVQELLRVVNQQDFKSKKGRSHTQLWYYLCELVCRNPEQVPSVRVAEVVKNGLKNFSDGVGSLWCSLADYYIRRVLFEKARDVYEEGMASVITVKDFGQIFDAYSQFMDSAICHEISNIDANRSSKNQHIKTSAAEDISDCVISNKNINDASQETVEQNNDIKGTERRSSRRSTTVKTTQTKTAPKKTLKKSSTKNVKQSLPSDKSPVSSESQKKEISEINNSQGIESQCKISFIVPHSSQDSALINSEIISKNEDSQNKETSDERIHLEIMMERFEDLMDRRALLLNSVLLRQNKHNVDEWIKRTRLLEGKSAEIIQTFTDAIQTVDPKYAVGHPNLLWSEFAKFYEENKQLKDARQIFEKGLVSPFKNVEDLANLWCDYAELELRNFEPLTALKLLRRATSISSKKMNVDFFDENQTAQARAHKSIKLWSFYVDLEENFGTFETTKSAYSKLISLKIATPQLVLNFTEYLENNRYFEESFKVFEQAINIFKWPHLNELWATYLVKFIEHFKSLKIERLRDLFEQCLNTCPPKFSFYFYILYGMREEIYGLARRALSIYERACANVPEKEKLTAYRLYAGRASEMFGVTSIREILDKALEVLRDEDSRSIGVEYADLETKLGEIDRARAIYSYVSQISNPENTETFWKAWYNFEVAYGNEETFRDMRRIKRTMEARFSIQPSLTASHMISVIEESGGKAMEELEKQVEKSNGESQIPVITQTLPFNKTIPFVKSSKPENQQIDTVSMENDAHSEISNKEVPLNIFEKPVPIEVFGSILMGDNTKS